MNALNFSPIFYHNSLFSLHYMFTQAIVIRIVINICVYMDTSRTYNFKWVNNSELWVEIEEGRSLVILLSIYINCTLSMTNKALYIHLTRCSGSKPHHDDLKTPQTTISLQ